MADVVIRSGRGVPGLAQVEIDGVDWSNQIGADDFRVEFPTEPSERPKVHISLFTERRVVELADAEIVVEGEPETYLSWCDDGVLLTCEREQCRDEAGMWFQKVLEPYRLLPEAAVIARNEHVATHGGDQ